MKQNNRSNKNEPSQRQLRVGEQLRHIIAETMSRGHFTHEALMDARQITVSEVRVSPDMRNATVFVMPLGGVNVDGILPALNEEAHTFQKAVGRQLNMKFTPRLAFRVDTTFDAVQKIDDLLRGVRVSDEHGDDDDDSSEDKA